MHALTDLLAPHLVEEKLTKQFSGDLLARSEEDQKEKLQALANLSQVTDSFYNLLKTFEAEGAINVVRNGNTQQYQLSDQPFPGLYTDDQTKSLAEFVYQLIEQVQQQSGESIESDDRPAKTAS